MIGSMVSTPQPHYLYLIVSGAESFSTAHGWAVNLFAVIALAALGVLFLSGRRWLVRYAMWFGVFFCLADWLLVQDLGFLGGVGTDPNSMIPMILLFSAGYLALAPAAPGEAVAAVTRPIRARGLAVERLPGTDPAAANARPAASASARSLVGASAVVILIGGGADGRCRREPDRRSHHRRGHLRRQRPHRLPGTGLHAHRPGRPHRDDGQPARQGRS